MAASLSVAENLQRLGLAFKQLHGDEVIEREPALSPIREAIVGGLYFPDDESGDALLFCQALAHALAEAGGVICRGTLVQHIKAEGGKVVGVETTNGFIAADRVIVAAGNQSPMLLKPLGIALPIKPVKGYSLTLDLSHFAARPALPVIDDGLHMAATPLGTQLRLAGTAEFAGFDKTLDPRRVENLLNLLQALYPAIDQQIDRKAVLPWAGFRPVSADGKPFIGPSAIKGLYINTGHGHLGWTMAMGSAHLLAHLIGGQPPEISSMPFNPMR